MELSNNRIPEINDYFKLSESSVFFDIGSGTGMVVLHVGVKVGCRSFGVEVSSNRFKLSLDLKDSLVDSNLISEALGDKFHFFNNNCASFEDLALIDN
jgi:cyclopropane fatty-acyl-phospholipid synthase-like methyltransferase